jgi:CBS domain containing-hemolysin-like protein
VALAFAAAETSHGPDAWTGLGIAALLVLINGFFVAAEFALVRLRPTQIEPLASAGDRRARIAAHMLENVDRYLSASQLGITLTSLALGWIGEPAFAWIVHPVIALIPGVSPEVTRIATVAVAFFIITALHIVVGEQAPKSFAIRKPVPTSLWVSMPLYAFSKLAYPAIWILNKASIGLIRLVGIEPADDHELGHSEEEFRQLLVAGTGSISPPKGEMLDNVFELSLRTARQVMIPRADVVFLSTTHPLQENLRIARHSGHTRFPVCEGDLDSAVGLVHIKDIFRQDAPPPSLDVVQRPIHFVPESMTLDRLLIEMREKHSHMFAVVDEYGGVNGIVTLENVIEEVVGEIQDEFDEEKPELVATGEDTYRVSGGMLVADLERALAIEFSDRDEDTVGGIVLTQLGRAPRVRDRVEVGPLELVVLGVKKRRIQTLEVRVLRTPAHAPESASGPGASH